MRLLIVDDVKEMRVWLSELMMAEAQKKGVVLHVFQASHALEARREIERNRPDLLLIDELLPYGDSGLDLGLECLKLGLKVILTTGMIEQPTQGVQDVRELGFLSRVIKPDLSSHFGHSTRDKHLLEFLEVVFDALKH